MGGFSRYGCQQLPKGEMQNDGGGVKKWKRISNLINPKRESEVIILAGDSDKPKTWTEANNSLVSCFQAVGAEKPQLRPGVQRGLVCVGL